jgi:hypothetical protein
LTDARGRLREIIEAARGASLAQAGARMSSFDVEPTPESQSPWTPAPTPAVDGAIQAYEHGTAFAGTGGERTDSMTVAKDGRTATDAKKTAAAYKDQGAVVSRSTSSDTVYSPQVSAKNGKTTSVDAGKGRAIVSRSESSERTVGERTLVSDREEKVGWKDGVVAESKRHQKTSDKDGSTEETRRLAYEDGKLSGSSADEVVTKKTEHGKVVSSKQATDRSFEVGKDSGKVAWGSGSEHVDGAAKTKATSSKKAEVGYTKDGVAAARSRSSSTEGPGTSDGMRRTKSDTSHQEVDIGKEGGVLSWGSTFVDAEDVAPRDPEAEREAKQAARIERKRTGQDGHKSKADWEKEQAQAKLREAANKKKVGKDTASRSGKLGYQDGHVVAGYTAEDKAEDVNGSATRKTSVALDKGTLKGGRSREDVVKETVGDEKRSTTTTSDKTVEASKDQVKIGWGSSESNTVDKAGMAHTTTDARTRSLDVGKTGGIFSWARSGSTSDQKGTADPDAPAVTPARAKEIEEQTGKTSHSKKGELGYKDGHVVAGHSNTTRTEDAKGSSENTSSVALKDGKLDAGLKQEYVTKQAAGGQTTTTTTSAHQSFQAGKDGAALAWGSGKSTAVASTPGKGTDALPQAAQTVTTGDPTGSTQTSQQNKLGYQKGHVVAERSHTTTTTAADGGTRSRSTSYGMSDGKAKAAQSWGSTNAKGTSRETTAGAEVGKDSLAIHAGHTLTTKSGKSFAVSAKAGVKVFAAEPEQVGDRFVVKYTRTATVGGAAKGSAKVGAFTAGVSASGSVSDIESGSRSFATKEEAEKFRSHAAARIGETADPGTVKGALSMEIGESRGHGSALEGEISGSLGAYGVTLGAGATKKSSDGLDIRRVSANVFEVTYHAESEKGKHLDVSAPVFDMRTGTRSGAEQQTVVQFDLANPEGQTAFSQFCNDHVVPAKGAVVIRREKGAHDETYGGLTVPGGFSSTSSHKTSENEVIDKDGRHETYAGEQKSRQTAGWIGHKITGDKDMNRSLEVVAKQTDDAATGYSIRGVFGGESGEHTRGGMQHLFGPQADGESWDRKGKSIEDGASGEWTMSAEIDPAMMAEMAKRVPELKGMSLDARMKALSKSAAELGLGGIRALDAQLGGKGFDWDVELKGDRNFPGKAGREALDGKIAGFTSMLDASEDAAGATLVEPIAGELSSLRFRRSQMADPEKYLDLPDALRAQQLAIVDQQLQKLEQLRHRAAIAAMKQNPGESVNDIALRVAEDGYAGMTPEQRQLARTRDEIAMQDAAIVGYQQQSEEASIALSDGVLGGKGIDWQAEKARDLGGKVSRLTGEAAGKHKQQVEEYLALDRDRMGFLRADPTRAAALGEALLEKLIIQSEKSATVAATYHEAATAFVQIMRSTAAAKHLAFWADVSDSQGQALP